MGKMIRVGDIIEATVEAAYNAIEADRDNVCGSCGTIHEIDRGEIAESLGLDLYDVVVAEEDEDFAPARPIYTPLVVTLPVPERADKGKLDSWVGIWVDGNGVTRGWWVTGPGKPELVGPEARTAEQAAAEGRGWETRSWFGPGENPVGYDAVVSYLRGRYETITGRRAEA